MELLGKTLVQLKTLLEKKEVSASELHDYFIKRIKKYDGKLNSHLTLLEKFNGNLQGLLKGIPLSMKDNFSTFGVKTTASSYVLENYIAPYDATVTLRLKKEGMSLLGKTNMDAWAHGSSTETSDFGPTHNPWNIKKVPGGSSGGSAAAVCAYLSPGAIGSETAGSIRLPAAWCGIVGLKPTYGRVSRYGVIAMGSSLDCPGPMTRTVEDAAFLLSIIAGHDSYDATSSERKVPNYLDLLKTTKKLKIGVCEDYYQGATNDVKAKIEEALKLFEEMGHTIIKIKLINPKYAVSVYTIIQRAEVSSNLSRYDGVRFGTDRTHFGEEAKRRVMLGAYTLSHGYYDAFYKRAQKVRTLIIQDFEQAFKEVDIIVAPTTPTTALTIGEWEKYPFFGEQMDVLNEPAAVAGIPAISIPVGLDKSGMPIGLQIQGRHFDEAAILSLAHAFELKTDFFGITRKILQNYKD